MFSVLSRSAVIGLFLSFFCVTSPPFCAYCLGIVVYVGVAGRIQRFKRRGLINK